MIFIHLVKIIIIRIVTPFITIVFIIKFVQKYEIGFTFNTIIICIISLPITVFTTFETFFEFINTVIQIITLRNFIKTYF